MKDRIKLIMESQHMSQQSFADFLGISPASLSSIFSDRTKPTLNTVGAIMAKFPNINVEWLLSGVGEMYKHVDGEKAASGTGQKDDSVQLQLGLDVDEPGASYQADGLFGPDSRVSPLPAHGQPTRMSGKEPVHQPSGFYSQAAGQSSSNRQRETIRTEVKYVDKPSRKITEIRVFFDDGTYETFEPQK